MLFIDNNKVINKNAEAGKYILEKIFRGSRMRKGMIEISSCLKTCLFFRWRMVAIIYIPLDIF